MSTRFMGNFFLTYDIVKGLQFKSSISTDVVFLGEKSFIPNDIKRGQASNGQAAIANQRGLNWTWENTLNYSKHLASIGWMQ
jgi:hypothetical protein